MEHIHRHSTLVIKLYFKNINQFITKLEMKHIDYKKEQCNVSKIYSRFGSTLILNVKPNCIGCLNAVDVHNISFTVSSTMKQKKKSKRNFVALSSRLNLVIPLVNS